MDLIDNAPKEISKKELSKYILKKIRAIYQYKEKPPRWLHNPEWPLIQGKPLVFVEQDGEPNDILNSKYDNKINYYFRDDISNEMIIITQFD